MSQLVHIANYFDADRISATAGEVMAVGDVINVAANPDGSRKLMKVDAAADLKSGLFGIVWAVSMDPLAVQSSTASAKTGTRILSVAQNDDVVWVGPGAVLEYDVSQLDASLDPARSGTLPTVGAHLGVKAAKFCAVGAASAIINPVVATVIEVFGGNKVRIKLHDPQATA